MCSRDIFSGLNLNGNMRYITDVFEIFFLNIKILKHSACLFVPVSISFEQNAFFLESS